MEKVLALFASIRLLFAGKKDLKASSAKALNILSNAKADITDAALSTLQADAKAAAAAEAENETARLTTLTNFDNLTTAQVDALRKKLNELERRRSSDRRCLADELATERLEAEAEAEIATTTEAELAAAIEALQTGADAQAGLNTANEE